MGVVKMTVKNLLGEGQRTVEPELTVSIAQDVEYEMHL
jgi:hypothetical protein